MRSTVLLLAHRRRDTVVERWAAALVDLGARGVTVLDGRAEDEEGVARSLGTAGTEFLVVASPDADAEEIAGNIAHRAALDPLNVEVIPPEAIGFLARAGHADEDVPRLVRAALAGAQEARLLPPDCRRSVSVAHDRAVSRRRVFTVLFRPSLIIVPAIAPARCAARHGCVACRDACPTGAMRIATGSARLSPEACVACGACATVCPTGALVFPPIAPDRLARRLRALLGESRGEPPVLLFAGRRALAAMADRGWTSSARILPVDVACAGAVSPALVLFALRAGAGGVLLAPCPEGAPCAAACGNLARRTVASVRSALALANDDATAVHLLETASSKDIIVPPRRTVCATRNEAPLPFPREVAELLRTHGVTDGDITDDSVPAGTVALDAATCTVCGRCAATCPTGALALDLSAEGARLTFEAASCVGCALCETACPENVVHASRRLDASALVGERVELARSSMATCVDCGRALEPAALVAAVAARIGGGSSDTWRRLFSRCPDCRLVAGAAA